MNNFDIPKGVHELEVEKKNEEERSLHNKSVALTAALVASLGIHAISDVAKADRMPINPDGTFEILSMNNQELILGKNGSKYTIKINELSKEIKDSLIKQNPVLESFITNGSINIVN